MKILHISIITISIVAVFFGILILSALMYPKDTGFTNGEAATIVLGQSSFTTGRSGTTATMITLINPYRLAIDTSRNVWVADNLSRRILMYPKGTGFTNGEAATIVLGQSSFTTGRSGTTATMLLHPFGLAFDS